MATQRYELLVSYDNGGNYDLIAEYDTIIQAQLELESVKNWWLANQSFKKKETIIYQINKVEYDEDDEQTDNIEFIMEIKINGNY